MSDTPDWAAPQSGGEDAPPPGALPSRPPDQPPAAGWGPQGGWAGRAVKPGVIPLRPLGLGEILDGAFTTIRQYPRATLGLSAVFVTVSQLLQFGLAFWLLRSAPTEDTVTFVAVTVRLVTGVTFLALSGLLTVVVGEAVLGRSIGLGEAWRRVWPRLGALLGAALLTMLLLVVGLLLLILPGLYLAVALSLTTPALMLEGQPVGRALRRSRELVRGSWWRCLGILVLTGVVAAVLQTVLTLPFVLATIGSSALFDTGFETLTVALIAFLLLGAIVAQTVVMPFAAGVIALLYVDRRMRVEGLDVTLAQAALSPDASPPVA